MEQSDLDLSETKSDTLETKLETRLESLSLVTPQKLKHIRDHQATLFSLLFVQSCLPAGIMSNNEFSSFCTFTPNPEVVVVCVNKDKLPQYKNHKKVLRYWKDFTCPHQVVLEIAIDASLVTDVKKIIHGDIDLISEALKSRILIHMSVRFQHWICEGVDALLVKLKPVWKRQVANLLTTFTCETTGENEDSSWKLWMKEQLLRYPNARVDMRALLENNAFVRGLCPDSSLMNQTQSLNVRLPSKTRIVLDMPRKRADTFTEETLEQEGIPDKLETENQIEGH